MQVRLGQASLPKAGGINQDFHGAMLPEGALRSSKGIALALADGIGSSAVSHLASAAAVRGFLADYYSTADSWSVLRSAQRVLDAVNAWLHAQSQRGDARFDRDRGHVCTFSALVLKGREAHLFHVGDARVMRLHAQALEPLSEDHRAPAGPGEHYLARALGAGPGVEIDYRHWPLVVGEVYVLATDGAWEHLDAAAVHSALAGCDDDLDQAAARLVAAARERGSEDDATVQLLRIDALPDAREAPPDLERAHLRMPPALAPRMHFEGHELVRSLHASSRSHLWLAQPLDGGAPVVIKVPSVDLQGDEAYLDRFLVEEWVARRIDNVHVVKAAAADHDRTWLHAAFEYVDGQTLRQWMIDHPRPSVDEVRALVAQIADGLQALHRKEMLHQDLRPENVMIDRSGTVRLIDFASVHVAGWADASRAPPSGEILGTLQYTAPEYFVGGVVDGRADLYALAVLTYQMLSGELPYGLDVTRVRTQADVKRLVYRPLRDRRPELPAWLDAVLMKALQPSAIKRQGEVAEFVHDLASPGPEFLKATPAALVERHPVRFWQLTSLVLLIAVLALLARDVLRAGP